MSYDAENHGTTEGKVVSRNQITRYFSDLMYRNQELKTLTLPSNVGIQERDLHQQYSDSKFPFSMDCIELNKKVYNSFADEFQLEKMNYHNEKFEDAIHSFQQYGIKHNAIWFDACGNFKTFAKQFIEACLHNLDDSGLAFFTAKVSSRKKGENIKYLYDYYKTPNDPDVNEVTDNMLVRVYSEYLKSRLPDLNLFYELTYDTASGHSFVVFGVAKNYKVRKKSRIIENHQDVIAKGHKYKKLSEINMDLAIAMFKEGVIYKDIAKYFNVSYQSFTIKMRQLGFRSNRKAWIDTCSIEEALATDSIKLLLTPKEEETMNSKLANEVLRLTQQGQSSEEIAQEIGQSKMQVAGIKASISRGTYGDTKKKALAKAKQRGQVLAMLGKNKTDEQIIAKVGISKGTLGSYKAHVTMANS